MSHSSQGLDIGCPIHPNRWSLPRSTQEGRPNFSGSAVAAMPSTGNPSIKLENVGKVKLSFDGHAVHQKRPELPVTGGPHE